MRGPNVDVGSAGPAARSEGPRIERVDVAAYRIPTDAPESDGTLEWTSTTLVAVHATAGGQRGFGYSYADTATAQLIRDLLAGVVIGRDAMAVSAGWEAMLHATRNLGRVGIVAMAIAAVDAALWDLKARLLDVPLVTLLGAVRDCVPVYGSGGFTSYSIERIQQQLGEWVAEGISRVKMKVGRDAAADPARVRAARAAVGPHAGLFVDANAAYTRKQALDLARTFAESGVSWFEEPVSSDDLAGLRLLRDRVPPGMNIAAGEYGYDLVLLPAHAGRRRRGRAAGRRDALRGDHRVSARRRAVRGAADAAVGALRTVAARAGLLHHPARLSHRVFPRSRAHRTHAVRRRAHARARLPAARPLPAGIGLRPQGGGRRAICRVDLTRAGMLG